MGPLKANLDNFARSAPILCRIGSGSVRYPFGIATLGRDGRVLVGNPTSPDDESMPFSVASSSWLRIDRASQSDGAHAYRLHEPAVGFRKPACRVQELVRMFVLAALSVSPACAGVLKFPPFNFVDGVGLGVRHVQSFLASPAHVQLAWFFP